MTSKDVLFATVLVRQGVTEEKERRTIEGTRK